MKDLQEGVLTLNLEVPVTFNRENGSFDEVYKETIEKYGPEVGEDDLMDWYVVNSSGSIFNTEITGDSTFRKGKTPGQFQIIIGDSTESKLGELKFISIATYQLIK